MPSIERTQSGECGSASVDESKKIWIGNANVGISNWGGIVGEVRGMALKDDAKISEELLKRVKKNDFVPKRMEGEYRKVLLEEYKMSQ
jgi:hypothetical protein